ncbi:ABC transporter permease subunit [Janibacter melonis]|uniref:ABC transporter permease subunit n=1 Tax=Janibacter melonis TaxID=262209 RepID=A0A5P8FPY0_9MICO|nr:ABC transporter permease subunit [Janibacter melonis]
MTEATHEMLVRQDTPEGGDVDESRSLLSDGWRQLRRNWIFWASLVLITAFILMAVFPSLLTSQDPGASGALKDSHLPPSSEHLFGTNLQGRDVLARCIYGARASILVGVLTTLATLTVGSVIGILAGYFGGIFDTIFMRVTDIFFAIPLLLGGILFMSTFPNEVDSGYFAVVLKVVIALSILGWPSVARLMRGSALQVKPNDYVQAARALGASPWRIIRSHVLPNAMAPVIVVSMINLGAYIAAEATLSFLGIGLAEPAVSWGIDISGSLDYIRVAWWPLVFPSLFLSLAVLAFIMLGDAVRDAFDPRSR